MASGDIAGAPLAEAMNRLWAKYLPQMEERVATLKNAAARLAGGNSLTEAEQSHASEDAHKLAGVLGTFGLKDGTELAREAEQLYGGALDGDLAVAERLSMIAAKLKAMVAGREQGQGAIRE
ncbi:MAG TPA: Hpt domain-containing protein [Terracidiphilus sp.]|jgi:chemotaxis protein histidine kinase CheA